MGLCASKNRELALGSADSSTSLKKKRKSGGNKSKKRKNSDSGYGDCNGGIGGHGMDINENELHRIPGRMFVSGASDVACLFTQQGRKGTNQDAMLVWENFNSRSDTVFCGVFDGHGPYGHMVAKKVRDSLPLKLYTQWNANSSSDQNINNGGSMDSEDTSVSMDEEWCDPVDENETLPEVHLPLKKSFLKAFKLVDKDLKLNKMIDCFCSGSTAVTMIKQGQDLVIGNVGDSRAILGTRDKNNSLIAVQLTVDLKPNLPREAARIQQCKGRVFALQDEPDVPRVWLPNNDSPGLAMARAFGDFCLKEFGLISVPDVSYRRLTDVDEFIVLATDGIWDVLSNKEVVDIIASAPSRATAARALVDCAVRAWKLKFPTSKSDDCAVVCLFLDHSLPTNQPQEDATLEDSTKKPEPMISVANDKETAEGNAQDAHLDGPQNHVLQHSGTVREPDEIVPVSEATELKLPERSQSTRSLAECISTAEDEEWSALEGVTRVNSLLTLPRFLSGDKRSGSWRKWL